MNSVEIRANISEVFTAAGIAEAEQQLYCTALTQFLQESKEVQARMNGHDPLIFALLHVSPWELMSRAEALGAPIQRTSENPVYHLKQALWSPQRDASVTE